MLLCYSSSMPYSWVLTKFSIEIHHGDNEITTSTLYATIPQLKFHFILVQFIGMNI